MLKNHRWGHFNTEYTAKGVIKISSLSIKSYHGRSQPKIKWGWQLFKICWGIWGSHNEFRYHNMHVKMLVVSLLLVTLDLPVQSL